MKANNLIGKKVLRTGPNGHGDWSYTRDPLIIMGVCPHHIIAEDVESGEEKVLNAKWMDDKWTAYKDGIVDTCCCAHHHRHCECHRCHC